MVRSQKYMSSMNPINTVRFELQPTEFYSIKRLVSTSDLPKGIDLTKATINDGIVEVYISPSVLSYTLIDNILNLDNRIEGLKFGLNAFTRPLESQSIYLSSLTDDLHPLLHLHSMNLYESKFKQGQYRGGQRFLFRNNPLKQHLNHLLRKTLPNQLLHNFSSVNNVFRFNHFQPEDGEFHEHYDIPYVDMKNRLISRYSLLIYLTEGENEKAVLEFGDKLPLKKLEAGSCVLFCHRYPHAGRPYANGPKLFIRTELIYSIPHDGVVKFDAEAAKAFNKACYISKQSIFDKQLEQHSSTLFRQFCQRRLLLKNDAKSQTVYLHKKPTALINDSPVSGLQFITDGNDYYFSGQLPLKLCAAVAIHDYFNAGDANELVDKYRLDTTKHDPQQVFDAFFKQRYPKVGEFDPSDSRELFEGHLMIGRKNFRKVHYEQPDCNRSCRPSGHDHLNIIVKQCTNTVHKQKASMQLLDQLYTFNLADMVVQSDRLYFNVSDSLKNFNFASCYCSHRFPQYFHEYYGEKAGRSFYNLPHMLYRRTKNMLVLNLDMFRNGLCLKVLEREPQPHNTQVRILQ